MEAEVEDTSSESEEDAPPEAERPARKRKRDGEVEENIEAKLPSVVLTGKIDEDAEDVLSISSESSKSGKSSSENDDEEESPSAKFRRGKSTS